MNKLIAGLLASVFAVSTAFAASHAGAPMTPASGAKAEAKSEMKAEKKVAKKKVAKKTKAKKAAAAS